MGAEFESLVRHCKARAAELSKSIEKGPPGIQLGKTSRTTISRYSSLASEIIDDQLELAHLQAEVELHEMEQQAEAKAAERRRQAEAETAERRRQAEAETAERRRQAEADAVERQRQLDAEEMERQNALARARDKVELFKKLAEIQAKFRKQQSLGSQHSVRSSQKSKSSKASRSIKTEVEQRLGSGFLNFNLGDHTSNVVKPGKTLRAAAEPKEPQNKPKEKDTTKLALTNGAAREPSLHVQ